MNVLITGGAGFIGSHLADALLAQGHAVTALDDLSTGSHDNLRPALANPACRFVQGDVATGAELPGLVAAADLIFHFAATVGVDLVVNHPVRTIETNVHGTERVFQLAAAAGKRVFVASTSEVYGRLNNAVFTEDDDLAIGSPAQCRWSYAASKLLDECLAFAYLKETRLRPTIVRFFNIVGPRQTGRYGMVLPRFVGQALRQEPLRVFGDGSQIRCFCHVADTVTALLRLASAEDCVGEIFNIGSPEPISIQALAERVIHLTGSRSTIQRIPYDQAYGPGFEDMYRRVPGIEKIHRFIGWAPTRSLDETIRDLVAEQQAAPAP